MSSTPIEPSKTDAEIPVLLFPSEGPQPRAMRMVTVMEAHPLFDSRGHVSFGYLDENFKRAPFGGAECFWDDLGSPKTKADIKRFIAGTLLLIAILWGFSFLMVAVKP